MAIQGEVEQVGTRVEGVPRSLPRIIDDIQLVPPREEVPEERLDPRFMVETVIKDHKEPHATGWSVVTSRRDRRPKNGSQSRVGPSGLADTRETSATLGPRGGPIPARKTVTRIPKMGYFD